MQSLQGGFHFAFLKCLLRKAQCGKRNNQVRLTRLELIWLLQLYFQLVTDDHLRFRSQGRHAHVWQPAYIRSSACVAVYMQLCNTAHPDISQYFSSGNRDETAATT